MTTKVFWENPYLTELESTVLSVEGNFVTVDKTIFYAFSGGQESDHGTFGHHRVVEARKQDAEIIYELEEGHSIKGGEKILMKIDWTRRYSLMRLHFAAEVILELMYQNFPSITKVGAHIGQEKARIDFAWHENLSSSLSQILLEAEEIVRSDQEIESAFSDKTTERRYWKINEFGQVPCGGTHIRRTGEIGTIKLKRVNPGKGRERVEIYVR
jgi:Ser-tRNA(Ala) deacylase AlaX